MKFSAGYWQMRAGVEPHYAVQVVDTRVEADCLTVYAPSRRIRHRGDTLNIALLTVEYSSPMANVIRVRAYHHDGGVDPGVHFQLFEEQGNTVSVDEDDTAAWLTSGDLTVRVDKGNDFRVSFLAEDKPLTYSGWRGLAYLTADGEAYMREQLGLDVGECTYGLGERFTPFVKNGQVIDMWNEDGGTSSEIAYKNIPFYLTNRGYGVFVNHPEKVSFEVASEDVERVQFSVPGEVIEYFVIYGPAPKQILERYTALTGRPALPPAWSFGLWLTTSFTTQYDEETVTSFIEGMASRDLPLHVFHYDCFWMKEFQWCDFEWDNRVFPDPQGMLARLKERGLHICVWVNPYIAQKSALFEEGKQHGYLLKRSDGSVWQCDLWQAGMGLVDFTNPAARTWYADKLRTLVEMGVDCFKTDFGERIPTDVAYHNGADPVRMHNYYSFLYNQTVFELLEETLGKGQGVLFARSATAGGQQFPVHWGGDSTASFISMAETLRAGLSLGLSGFGFWSHDIGGFEQTAPAEVYKRWCAFGLLSSHSRLHGSTSYRVPWLYDEEAVDVLRHFTRLKCRLMPYLYGAAVEAHQSGTPMLRAMIMEFPDDPACDTLDRQYMLGADLLVAPVFHAGGEVGYYLPEETWGDLLGGELVEGGRWLKAQHDVFSLPLLVRPNAVIPMGNNDDRPDYDYADGVTLHLYHFEDGTEQMVNIPAMDGTLAARFVVQRAGSRITVSVAEGKASHWSVALHGSLRVKQADGGVIDGDGSVPQATGDQMFIELAEG